MNADERLLELIEAETSVSIHPFTSAQGWERLAGAVNSGTPAISVPLSTIPLNTSAMIAQGVAVAVAVGAIGVTAIVALAPVRSHVTVAPTTTDVVVVESNSIAPVPVERGTPATVLAVPLTPARESGGSATRTLPNAAVSGPVKSTRPDSPLAEEMRLISRAKREIDRGQPHLAQVWLDEHRSRFRAGVLSAERDGLGVLMACRAGNSTNAQARADAYASKYPGSPILDRIRRACLKGSAVDIP